jgi:hypothetical protein
MLHMKNKTDTFIEKNDLSQRVQWGLPWEDCVPLDYGNFNVTRVASYIHAESKFLIVEIGWVGNALFSEVAVEQTDKNGTVSFHVYFPNAKISNSDVTWQIDVHMENYILSSDSYYKTKYKTLFHAQNGQSVKLYFAPDDWDARKNLKQIDVSFCITEGGMQ